MLEAPLLAKDSSKTEEGHTLGIQPKSPIRKFAGDSGARFERMRNSVEKFLTFAFAMR